MHYQSKSLAFVQTLLQTCFIYELKKNYMIIMLANLELIFLLRNNYAWSNNSDWTVGNRNRNYFPYSILISFDQD